MCLIILVFCAFCVALEKSYECKEYRRDSNERQNIQNNGLCGNTLVRLGGHSHLGVVELGCVLLRR